MTIQLSQSFWFLVSEAATPLTLPETQKGKMPVETDQF